MNFIHNGILEILLFLSKLSPNKLNVILLILEVLQRRHIYMVIVLLTKLRLYTGKLLFYQSPINHRAASSYQCLLHCHCQVAI